MKTLALAFAAGSLLLSSYPVNALAEEWISGSSRLGDFATSDSPAPSAPASVIGPDSRRKVDASRPYPYPFRTGVYIAFASTKRCSGVLVGPKHVLTAGSCIAPGGTGQRYNRESYLIYPGLRGDNHDWKRGRCKSVLRAVRLDVASGWLNSKNEAANYGLIELNCAVGHDLGWLAFGGRDGSLKDLPTVLGGYPTDKAGRFLWYSTGRITVSGTNMLFYNNDTSRGEIGAPVVANIGEFCPRCVVAINTNSRHGGGAHGQFNHGVRITRSVFNTLMNWGD